MLSSFLDPSNWGRTRSDACIGTRRHTECNMKWCRCTCHDKEISQVIYPQSAYKSPLECSIQLMGPQPAYIKYFHNIIAYGYADAITHKDEGPIWEYTIELTHADRASFEAQLGNVKSITLEYKGECKAFSTMRI